MITRVWFGGALALVAALTVCAAAQIGGKPAKGNPKMCAALISCDGATGRAHDIRRIMLGE